MFLKNMQNKQRNTTWSCVICTEGVTEWWREAECQSSYENCRSVWEHLQ